MQVLLTVEIEPEFLDALCDLFTQTHFADNLRLTGELYGKPLGYDMAWLRQAAILVHCKVCGYGAHVHRLSSPFYGFTRQGPEDLHTFESEPDTIVYRDTGP